MKQSKENKLERQPIMLRLTEKEKKLLDTFIAESGMTKGRFYKRAGLAYIAAQNKK
jgi:hypothetical protein